jgi:hypothetical protein
MITCASVLLLRSDYINQGYFSFLQEKTPTVYIEKELLANIPAGLTMRALVFAIIIVILIIIICNTQPFATVQVDGRKWRVLQDYSNNAEAAELLSDVNASIIEFMRYLKEKYHVGETDDIIAEEGPIHQQVAQGDNYTIVCTLLSNYNPDVFYESDNRTTFETSWTVNKGDAMYICLRDKNDPTQLIDRNLVLFVMLHEAAHIANYNGWGHPPRFWEVFKFLLHEAEESGIMRNIDYARYPQWYCGLYMDYNPYFDNDLRSIWQV